MDENSEYLKKMSEKFPDYPCSKCDRGIRGACKNGEKCPIWVRWFGDNWKKVIERLKRSQDE